MRAPTTSQGITFSDDSRTLLVSGYRYLIERDLDVLRRSCRARARFWERRAARRGPGGGSRACHFAAADRRPAEPVLSPRARRVFLAYQRRLVAGFHARTEELQAVQRELLRGEKMKALGR
ncbi:MAG: hypothetical protein R3F11_14535 [Verrucomicrobiales bacterium]